MNYYKKLKKFEPTTITNSDNNVLLLCKILKNYLNGTLKSTYNQIHRLKEYQDVLRKLSLPINKLSIKKRKNILKQEGSGLISILLPILVSSLWKTLNSKK